MSAPIESTWVGFLQGTQQFVFSMACSCQLTGDVGQCSWIHNVVTGFGVLSAASEDQSSGSRFHSCPIAPPARSGTFQLVFQSCKCFTLYCLSCLWKCLAAKASLRSCLCFEQCGKGKEDCKTLFRQDADCSAAQHSLAGLLFLLAALVRTG